MISKQHLAIGIINTVISNWEDTYPMLCEHPKLKKDLIYIRDLLKDKYLRKLKEAECHMYYVLEGVAYEADLANDLERIQMPKTKLTKQEYDSFRNKWIKDTVYFMERDQLENYAKLYFQQDLKTEDQESAFESMQNIDDEVFTTLANKFNLEVN